MVDKCKFCGQTVPLIKAHIFPKFMFKSVFSEKNKIMQVDFVDESKTREYFDTGFDNNLFCKECDSNKIGKFESYFADKIMGKRGSSAKKEVIEEEIASKGDVKIVKVSGLDYSKLKLFFLSLLLRSSLTTNRFFKEVDVKPFHKELIKMIESGIACVETKFKIVMFYIEEDDKRPYNSVICPRRSKQDGNTYYIFYIACYVIFINISDHNQIQIFEDGYLKSDGTLNKVILKGEEGRLLFESLVGEGVEYGGPFSLN